MNSCSGCMVLINGREIQMDDVQKRQMDTVVIESIQPERVLDVLLSDGQIWEMAHKGLFIESRVPEGICVLHKILRKYYVAVNERHQYLIAESDTGTETFGFSKSAETRIYEIIANEISDK